MPFLINLVISALVISIVTWLAGRFPGTAGFIAALPVTTMLVLVLAQLQHEDTEKTIALAKSIFAAVPITMVFLVPFLLKDRLGLGFWGAYSLGAGLLPVSFLVHRQILRLF